MAKKIEFYLVKPRQASEAMLDRMARATDAMVQAAGGATTWTTDGMWRSDGGKDYIDKTLMISMLVDEEPKFAAVTEKAEALAGVMIEAGEQEVWYSVSDVSVVKVRKV